MLKLLKARLHARECGLAVGVLRPALCCRDGNTSWAMHKAHACFNFIAVLAARPAGYEELYVAVAFERFAVGWIQWCQRNSSL